MLSKGGIYIITAILVLAPQVLLAQNGSGLRENGRKFTTIGFGLDDKLSDFPGLASSSDISRFLNLEKIVRSDPSWMDLPGDDQWDYSTRVVANYYFGYGAWVPMVGLSMGYIQDDNEETRFVAGPEIGLKYYMNPSTFVYGLLGYQLPFENIDDTADFYDSDRFVYGIGLGLSFSY